MPAFRWFGQAFLAARLSWLLDPLVWLISRVRGRLGWMVKAGPGPVRYP